MAQQIQSQISVVPDAHDARWLLAWLPDDVAINAILGRPPTPNDDLTGPRNVLEAARRARAARAPWVSADPTLAGDQQILDQITVRDDLRATFQGMNWRPAFVDLRRLLSMQQVVGLQGLADRVGGVSQNPQPLVDLCLPTQIPFEGRASNDPDKKGMAVSSPNLNLQVVGSGLGPVQVAPGVTRIAVHIFLDMPASHLQVAEYRGRYFVRDGYHRAAGLIREGVFIVPCILIQVRSLQELTAGKSGLFSDDVLLDERPPALTDFWDDSVAVTGKRATGEKIVRVRGDEFSI